MKAQEIKDMLRTSGQQVNEFAKENGCLPSPIIKLRRTPAQQAQRDEFLKAATLARNWINHIIHFAEKDNWSEVEFYLGTGVYDYKKMKGLLPTDRAEPQGN
ncbi:hypothetical protein DQC40_11565 [Salmonella enterica subsp. enterica serovar Coeln]|nr:hypothetical protein [Salmonella enterica subsp. enterica serovar Coeln]